MPKREEGKTKERRAPGAGYAAFTLGGVLVIILGAGIVLEAPIQPMCLVAWLFLVPACQRLGYSYREIEEGMMESIRQGMGAVLTILAVGGLIASWIFAGTVPAIIYWGLQIMSPGIFLPAAFILCGLVSLACGTSWGTLGTAGVAMFAVGESLGVPAGMTVGAIVSGAFFGDSLSPMSDSNNVAAASVGTDLLVHCREMGFLAVPAALLSCVLYYAMGVRYGAQYFDSAYIDGISAAISREFAVGVPAFLPVVFLLTLIFLKKPPMLSMVAGALMAFVVAVIWQGQDAARCMDVFWNGYTASTGEEFLDTLLNRGGVLSMAPTAFMMIFAFGMIGALRTAGILDAVVRPLAHRAKTLPGLTLTSEALAFIGNMMGTNTFSLLMSGSLLLPAYREKGLAPVNLSKAINAVATPGCTLIPWNASGLYVSALFGVSVAGYAPYACYVCLMPLAVLLAAFLGFRVIREAPESGAAKENGA